MSACLGKFNVPKLPPSCNGTACKSCDSDGMELEDWPLSDQPEQEVTVMGLDAPNGEEGKALSVIVRGGGRCMVWRHHKRKLKWVYGKFDGQVHMAGFTTREEALSACLTWMKYKATESELKRRAP